MKRWVGRLTLGGSAVLVALSLLHHPAPPASPVSPAATTHRAQRRLPPFIPGTPALPASPDVRPTPR